MEKQNFEPVPKKTPLTMKKPSGKEIKHFLLINLGLLLTSIGVYFFKFPNHFSTGGVSGISIILNKLFPNFSPSVLMLFLNVALMLMGFIFLGRTFGILTAYCTLMFSFETWALEQFSPLTAPLTDQPFLELCFAIMLPAIGSALLFNYNASSGGTDVIAMILKKHTTLDISHSLLISDSVIAASTLIFFGPATGLFSILGLFMRAFLVDTVIENINLCKYFSVVTSKPNQVNEYITKQLRRSATVIDAQGAYSGDEKKLIMTVCRRSEAVRLRAKIKDIDPRAFMAITNTSEIIGKGFRSV